MRYLPLSFLVLGLAITSAPEAQVSRNVKFLSNFKPVSGGQPYNDVWGYRNPANGKEYAILGTTTGAYIVDCSDPTKPVQRGFISYTNSTGWRVSTWRDMKTFGPWLYIVQERGGAGMQIVDLRDPDNPKYVKTWNSSPGWPNAHNIAMDLERGIAAVIGHSSYTYLIDVKTDPQNPKLLSRYTGNYQHDASMQNGWYYGAAIYAGRLEVMDMSNPASMVLKGWGITPRNFAHATWPTHDDKYVVVCDEWYRGPVNGGLSVWDVTTKTFPKKLAEYKAGPALAISHNCFIRDYVIHMSHYTEGYRTVDMSDPTNPVEVGYYDTWAPPVGQQDFNGAWGCYHLQPSGVMYISDRTSGLYVVKPRSSSVFYGDGTAGTNGVPKIHTIGCAYLGNANFKLGVRDGKASSAAVYVLGFKRANLDISGLKIHVDLVSPPPLVGGLATDAKGAALLSFPIPANAAFQDLKLDTQFFVLDDNGKLGFSATQGMEFELFAK